MIRRQPSANSTVKVTFILDERVHEGPVSVVGDFNDWRPGVHLLRRRANGTRSVSVSLPKGTSAKFRYLGAGGRWFDDHSADALERDGGLISV